MNTRTYPPSPQILSEPVVSHTGYDNGRAITSNDVVSILEADKHQGGGEYRGSVGGDEGSSSPTLEWHPLWKEHVISYRGGQDEIGGREEQQQHVATFPTLAFIQVRPTWAEQASAFL